MSNSPEQPSGWYRDPRNARNNPYVGRKPDPEFARVLAAAANGDHAQLAELVKEQEELKASRTKPVHDEAPITSDEIGATAVVDDPHITLDSSAMPLVSIPMHNDFSGGEGAAAPLAALGVYDGLAKLHPNTLINKEQIAELFGVKEKTIRRRVEAGVLPPPMKIGKKKEWIVGVLLEYLKDKAKRQAEEADAIRRRIRSKSE